MTAIIFPDAQLATRDLLRLFLADRLEPHALGATVSTKEPAPDAALPFVRPFLTGNSRDARLNGTATVRVNVWHRDEGLGLRLALLLEALLLDASSADIRGFTPAGGPVPTEDPDTGAPLSFFTLTARLRPRNL